jgi:hypothetical protein
VASLRAAILPQASATFASTGNILPSNLSGNSAPPFLESAPTRSDRQAFHAIAELCQRDDTEENPILNRGFHPADEAGIS